MAFMCAEKHHHHHHKHIQRLDEVTPVAAGACALHKHRAKKDLERAHGCKIKEDVAEIKENIAVPVAVGRAVFAFHEHHEKKIIKKIEYDEKHKAKKNPEQAHGYKIREDIAEIKENIAVAVAVDRDGGFAFYEHHEKKVVKKIEYDEKHKTNKDSKHAHGYKIGKAIAESHEKKAVKKIEHDEKHKTNKDSKHAHGYKIGKAIAESHEKKAVKKIENEKKHHHLPH